MGSAFARPNRCRHRAVSSQSGYRYRYRLVVRLVCVPLCFRVSRVSRVCPGSPRCLFTGTGTRPLDYECNKGLSRGRRHTIRT